MNTRNYFVIGIAALLLGCGGGGDKTTPPPPPPPEDPVVVNFALADFTGVKVNGSFDFSIEQGNDFSVIVTIDAAFANDLNVTVQGEMLDIGFKPNTDVRARTLEVVVVMPAIQTIELTGSVDGTVAGFSGSTLDVLLSGDAFIEGTNLDFDFVTVNGTGSAQFEMAEVAALPAAHIEMGGSSSVTLNLMDFASVTGSLANSAALFYYGSSINLQVSTSNAASITRLGAGR